MLVQIDPPPPPPKGAGDEGEKTSRLRNSSVDTLKKVSDFPVPSRDVTNQTWPGIIKLFLPGTVWFVTFRPETGKLVTFFTVYEIMDAIGRGRDDVGKGCVLDNGASILYEHYCHMLT
jgi:hypothetical protein